VSTKIFVGGLPWSISDKELKSLFEEYGKVEAIKIVLNRETGKSKGYGFVDMEHHSDAETAITELNKKDIKGRTIDVSLAKSRRG
jgi:RNA recognition motif-containing protein